MTSDDLHSAVDTPSPAADPAAADQRRATIRLAMLPGIGPRTLAALLDHFGDASAVLSAPEIRLREVVGVGNRLVRTIRHADDHVDVAGLEQWCASNGIRIVCQQEANYPRPLFELIDAPPLLFVRGTLQGSDALAVAVVGTRHASVYGRGQAERMAQGLARAGVTVVSGLARGIDAAAHRGALDGGGRTIAVLGGGLASIYPPEHEGLAQRVADNGAVISEFRPDAKPRGGMFPQRNRLISGLSLAVVVIEAADRSGALITARLASEQGRDVYALPGPVTSRVSRGCHRLIRDGARLVSSADEVLEELGPVAQAVPTEDGRQLRNGSELLLNDQERAVLDAIEPTATGIDAVVTGSGLPIHRVLATISVLEMRKLIRRLSGQYVSRV